MNTSFFFKNSFTFYRNDLTITAEEIANAVNGFGALLQIH